MQSGFLSIFLNGIAVRVPVVLTGSSLIGIAIVAVSVVRQIEEQQ